MKEEYEDWGDTIKHLLKVDQIFQSNIKKSIENVKEDPKETYDMFNVGSPIWIATFCG